MKAGKYPLHFGRDRVYRQGDRLIVESAVDMADWQVRQYRKTAILIGGSEWCVAASETLGSRGVRYVLIPWPEGFHDLPGRTIRYDADYVRCRDETLRKERDLEWQAWVLLPFKPLIGLLPSGIKSEIENRFGISARSSTFFSLWLELLGFFLVGCITWIHAYAGLHTMAEASLSNPENLVFFVALAVVLLGDLIFRYGSYLREDRSPYGFCEWVIRRKRISNGPEG